MTEFRVGYFVKKVDVATIQDVALKYSNMVGKSATHCIVSHNNFIELRDYINLRRSGDYSSLGPVAIILDVCGDVLQINYQTGVKDDEVILYEEYKREKIK